MKKLILLPLVLSLVFFGCKPKSEDQQKKEAQSEIQKILLEAVDVAKNKKGFFDLKLVKDITNIGSEFTMNFQMREYPQKYKDWSEMMKKAKVGMGKASYKIIELKMMDKIGIWETKKGKKILVVYLQVKGDKGNFGHPSGFDQTGTDPSPQFFLVDPNGKKYPAQTAESNSVARSGEGQSLMTIKTTSDKWLKTVVAFIVDENIKEPTLVIQSKVGDKKYEIVGIKL